MWTHNSHTIFFAFGSFFLSFLFFCVSLSIARFLKAPRLQFVTWEIYFSIVCVSFLGECVCARACQMSGAAYSRMVNERIKLIFSFWQLYFGVQRNLIGYYCWWSGLLCCCWDEGIVAQFLSCVCLSSSFFPLASYRCTTTTTITVSEKKFRLLLARQRI